MIALQKLRKLEMNYLKESFDRDLIRSHIELYELFELTTTFVRENYFPKEEFLLGTVDAKNKKANSEE